MTQISASQLPNAHSRLAGARARSRRMGLGLAAKRPSPGTVIPGESTPACSADVFESTKKQKSIVDWCTATYRPSDESEVVLLWLHIFRQFMKYVQADAGKGMLGYQNGAKFMTRLADGQLVQFARIDWGGATMQHRARIDIAGTGCGIIKDFSLIEKTLRKLVACNLTRVDLAVDFLLGEHGVEDCRQWYRDGLFISGGSPPRYNQHGQWDDVSGNTFGRTYEVGKRENGKMLRAYEKGMQLGDPQSKWCRFEVELRNRDRDLPFEILTQTDKFFAGAYTCLAALVEDVPEMIATHQKEGEISLDHLVHHARRTYGKTINVLRGFLSADDLLDLIHSPGIPGRLGEAYLHGWCPSESGLLTSERLL